MKIKEKISPENLFDVIQQNWLAWASQFSPEVKFVIGISGGKDSTVVAYLAVKIFGADRVVGVTLPCDEQKEIDDSCKVIQNLGIKRVNINIGDAVYSINSAIENNAIDVSADTKTNLPCRIRTASLYAVAQSINGIVVNTSNLTEDILGYATLWGDTCGSFAPIQGLTVTEVISLGDWLGVPYDLCHKTPIDGLQELTDEEKLGMKYADVDKFIRKNEGTQEFKQKVMLMYFRNKFKIDMITLPGPKFTDLPNFVQFPAKASNLLLMQTHDSE